MEKDIKNKIGFVCAYELYLVTIVWIGTAIHTKQGRCITMAPIEIDVFGFGSDDEVTELPESKLNIEFIKVLCYTIYHYLLIFRVYSLISNRYVIELEYEFSGLYYASIL